MKWDHRSPKKFRLCFWGARGGVKQICERLKEGNGHSVAVDSARQLLTLPVKEQARLTQDLRQPEGGSIGLQPRHGRR